MLTKARSEYDKEGEGNEPRSLSLAVLFGSQHQHQHHHSPKPETISPMAASGSGSKVASSKPRSSARPAVARSLSYDEPVRSGGSGAAKGPPPVVSDPGIKAIVRGQPSGEAGGIGGPVVLGPLIMGAVVASGIGVTGVGGAMGVRGPVTGAPEIVAPGTVSSLATGMPASATVPHQHQQNQPQHCPAIEKLIQGQRGVGGVLQTLSESPENRLCENGVPLEHHHHHLHQHLHHQHHHHHQQQQQYHQNPQQQYQPDPIQRLFQTQPILLPSSSSSSSSAAPPCCPNPPPLQQLAHISSLQPSQPILVDSVVYSHPHLQHRQPLFCSPSKPHPETQPNRQSPSAVQGTGVSAHMPGVVSPHELLQKLQLVQQEQSLASHDAPRPCPGLAPRFPGAAPNQGPGPNLSTATTGHKAGLQFQVISPQRIPATVAPALLLSPSVFSQAKSSTGGFTAVPQDSCSAPPSMSRAPQQEELRVLSRSQLQATLLHLIQTDGSFLDSIYEAYVSRLANDTSSKY
ncbi:uncharacterized protein ACJ7VT_010738 [Polymixia lowei]